MSPTVLRVGPYRLFFFSNDAGEPPHIHVEREASVAKFWLKPVELARSNGFSHVEVRRIESIVSENVIDLLEAWDEFFTG